MAVKHIRLANPQPLVELGYNYYQQAFLTARRLRICPQGHRWSMLDHTGPNCPVCTERGKRAFRRFLLRAGRRGGKTRVGALAAIEETTIPGTIGWICAPTYPELEDFVMPAFFKQMPQAWLDHPDTDWDATKYTLTLPNKSIVQFRSLEDPERGRGPGLHWLWIDEICKLSLKHWETIRPTLADYGGCLIATTTPKGEDWVHENLYEPAEEGKPGYWACVYRTIDNPFMRDGEGAAEVAEAKDSMTPEMFAQEFLADIVTFTGAIFGEYVPPCVIEGTDEQMRFYFPEWPNLDLSRPSITGIDPGADHPFAASHWVASPHGLVKVGEYLARNAIYQTHAYAVQAMRRGMTGRCAIDRSQKQAQIELAQYGLYTVPAENDVVAGINRMTSWMAASKRSIERGAPLPTGGMVLPKSLVPKTIKQLQSYRWADNEKKDGTTKRELVHKKNDDLVDSDRYALMLYPELPKDQPVNAVGKRDLSAMPAEYREQVERMRRIEANEARAATDRANDAGILNAESVEHGEFEMAGVGDFNA